MIAIQAGPKHRIIERDGTLRPNQATLPGPLLTSIGPRHRQRLPHLPRHLRAGAQRRDLRSAAVTTAAGFERHWQTNHLGASCSRTCSRAHRERGVARPPRPRRAPDDASFDARPEDFDPVVAGAQSKTANVLFVVALVRRGASSFSLHPGGIRTNYVDALAVMRKRGVFGADNEPVANGEIVWKMVEQGASTTIIAMFDPSLQGRNGAYLNDGRIDDDAVMPYAVDQAKLSGFGS